MGMAMEEWWENVMIWCTLVSCVFGCVWKCCVPLNPMVLLIIIPIKWLFVWEYTLFSDKPTHDGDSWGYLRYLCVEKYLRLWEDWEGGPCGETIFRNFRLAIIDQVQNAILKQFFLVARCGSPWLRPRDRAHWMTDVQRRLTWAEFSGARHGKIDACWIMIARFEHV